MHLSPMPPPPPPNSNPPHTHPPPPHYPHKADYGSRRRRSFSVTQWEVIGYSVGHFSSQTDHLRIASRCHQRSPVWQKVWCSQYHLLPTLKHPQHGGWREYLELSFAMTQPQFKPVDADVTILFCTFILKKQTKTKNSLNFY